MRPGEFIHLTFGKHKGKALANIPLDYLQWVLLECRRIRSSLRQAIEAELQHRSYGRQFEEEEVSQEFPLADWSSIIRKWHRELCLKYHPDRGGAHAQMLVVNEAHEKLLELIEA